MLFCRSRLCARKIILQTKRLIVRSLLTSSYSSHETWEKRLDTPLLRPIKMDDYSFQILQKYEKEKYVSAIDLDIFCNKATLDEHADVIKELLPKFNQSKLTQFKYLSTHCAIIRLFLHLNRDEEIMSMLNDVNYMLYPDVFTSNNLMDYFIKRGKADFAAQIAYNLMLQEEIFPHKSPILKKHQIQPYPANSVDISSHVTPHLTLYALLSHFNGRYAKDAPIKDSVVPDASEATPKSNAEDEEITYVRVPYLKKYTFDDHFDIKKIGAEDPAKMDRLLLGKSLAYIGDPLVNTDYFNNIIGRSAHVLGLSLWRKFDKSVSVLQKYLKDDTEPAITQDSIDNFFHQLASFRVEIQSIREREKEEEANPKPSRHLPVFDYDQPPKRFELGYDLDQAEKECQELVKQLEKEKKISNIAPVFDMLTSYAKEKVRVHEKTDIEAQKLLFDQWICEREQNLENQIKEHFRDLKLREIAETRQKLEEEEKIVTFFEREKEIEMLLDKSGKIRDLIKRKNAPPPDPGDKFRSSFKYMTD